MLKSAWKVWNVRNNVWEQLGKKYGTKMCPERPDRPERQEHVRNVRNNVREQYSKSPCSESGDEFLIVRKPYAFTVKASPDLPQITLW